MYTASNRGSCRVVRSYSDVRACELGAGLGPTFALALGKKKGMADWARFLKCSGGREIEVLWINQQISFDTLDS